ncbi:hypothetical protein LAZ67_2003128 [Cordylochernes scorpioides]|uniref:CCHC-type domain-containing protein n=1 Tax=Cordylochernes scorpioides TaxID=51811 RepID=A0ABY6K3P3_9ARAC|nr:hypothetical protein LAZ67_2003128 [Cordylochernes scorpioides]
MYSQFMSDVRTARLRRRRIQKQKVKVRVCDVSSGVAEVSRSPSRSSNNIEQFVTECRRIVALHCKRVTPTRYERLPNVASLSDHDDSADLSSMIRQIVREEEAKISTIEDIVKEEIGRTLAPISKPRRSPPQKERPRQFFNTRYEAAQTIRPQPEPHYRKQGGRRETNEWRTTEGKPICFHCGRPGHVVRYCRNRQRQNEERRNQYYQG